MLLKIWLQFSKKSKKTNSKFENVFLLMDKTTLPFWNEPKHNYVGPPVTEMNTDPVGLRQIWFSGCRPISRTKIENFSIISQEQNVIFNKML